MADIHEWVKRKGGDDAGQRDLALAYISNQQSDDVFIDYLAEHPDAEPTTRTIMIRGQYLTAIASERAIVGRVKINIEPMPDDLYEITIAGDVAHLYIDLDKDNHPDIIM